VLVLVRVGDVVVRLHWCVPHLSQQQGSFGADEGNAPKPEEAHYPQDGCGLQLRLEQHSTGTLALAYCTFFFLLVEVLFATPSARACPAPL
jgi:hypothetical protein